MSLFTSIFVLASLVNLPVATATWKEDYLVSLETHAKALWQDDETSALEKQKKREEGQLVDMYIQTIMGGRTTDELNVDESNFLTVTLYESYWLTHNKDQAFVLTDITFEVEAVVDNPTLTEKGSWDSSLDMEFPMDLAFKASWFYTTWFCRWGCYWTENLGTMDEGELTKKRHHQDTSEEVHAKWETEFCERIKFGPFSSFQHVYGCQIIASNAPAPPLSDRFTETVEELLK